MYCFMRLPAILKILPIASSSWWRGVKSGKYPAPVKLSKNATAWRAEDICNLLEQIGRPEVQEQLKDSNIMNYHKGSKGN